MIQSDRHDGRGRRTVLIMAGAPADNICHKHATTRSLLERPRSRTRHGPNLVPRFVRLEPILPAEFRDDVCRAGQDERADGPVVCERFHGQNVRDGCDGVATTYLMSLPAAS